MISGEKKALVLAHPFFVKASKYQNEAPQRPETCTKQLYKPSRMKKRAKIVTANLVLILDMKPLWDGWARAYNSHSYPRPSNANSHTY